MTRLHSNCNVTVNTDNNEKISINGQKSGASYAVLTRQLPHTSTGAAPTPIVDIPEAGGQWAGGPLHGSSGTETQGPAVCHDILQFYARVLAILADQGCGLPRGRLLRVQGAP